MSIRITELDAINSLQDGDYVAVDNESTGTHKFKALDISANLAGNIANTYSSSASYAIGQYCLYNNNLYRCTTTISTPEAWNGAHWVQVTVGEGLYDKVDKVSGKALSTNDFTNAYKTKLDGIEAGAEVNVQANWTENDSSKDDYIKNKPVNATQSTSGFMSATDKQKLDSIASGAEVNVQANWTESDSSKDDYIKNKPTIDEGLSLDSINAVRNSAITVGINQVQSNLNTEITNRQNAVSAEQTARENAVSAEQLARENADNVLDGRLDTVEETLPNKANIDGSYDSMTVGNAEQLVSNVRVNDKTPYLFRTSGGSVDIGDREYINGIVGGTVAWNQLLSTSSGEQKKAIYSGMFSTDNVAIYNGHRYLVSFLQPAGCGVYRQNRTNFIVEYLNYSAPTVATLRQFIATATGTSTESFGGLVSKLETTEELYQLTKCMIIDLTQMFGSTIADYIYSLETANAGAGVAWFKKLFDKPYYAYNAGELKSVSGLVSHDMTGFNQWDEEWEVGAITASGNYPSTTNIRGKNYIPCIGGATYFSKCSAQIVVFQYDADKTLIRPSADSPHIIVNANNTFTTLANARYIRFYTQSAYGTTYKNDICINLAWDNSRNGEYEPYELHSYPLDTDLTLRGIPKLDANNNLYYDGDVYESDGTVTRKYGIVDLGTLDWSGQTTGTSGKKRFRCVVSGIKQAASSSARANIISTKYIADDWNSTYNCVDGRIAVATSNPYVAIYDESLSSSTDQAVKTAMSGVYLVYELATPTTETADPYQQTEIVSDFGTEEFVINDDVFAIPVGHNTDYPVNLVAKLEMAPNSPDGNGDYIVRQTNGMNEYVPLVIEDALPTIPSATGSYVLTVTVADGADPVLAWTQA